MKIIIAGGGTGGHIFPIIEFINECAARKIEVLWLGTNRGLERKHKPDGCTLIEMNISGFRGKNLFKKFISIVSLFFSIIKLIPKILFYRPTAIVCFGGYVSLPAGITSIMLGKSLYLHEQNAVFGTSNKILKFFSKKIFLGFPINGYNSHKIVLTGNPIRNNLQNQTQSSKQHDEFNVLVTGGSLGSEFINTHVPKVLSSINFADYGINKLNIFHQTGVNKSGYVRDLYSTSICLQTKDFFDDMHQYIFNADLIITRAGALTLSEISAYKKYCLMIPLPTSIDDHQLKNASIIEDLDRGTIFEEHQEIKILQEKIKFIMHNKKYACEDSKVIPNHFDAAKKILDCILN